MVLTYAWLSLDHIVRSGRWYSDVIHRRCRLAQMSRFQSASSADNRNHSAYARRSLQGAGLPTALCGFRADRPVSCPRSTRMSVLYKISDRSILAHEAKRADDGL